MRVEPGDWFHHGGTGWHHCFVVEVVRERNDIFHIYLPDADPAWRVTRAPIWDLEPPTCEPTDEQLAKFVAYSLTGEP